MANRVVCIEKENNRIYEDCRCIETIGIDQEDGIKKQTPSRVHRRIAKGERFYIKVDDERTYLEKAERNGKKYVRTEKNDTKKDNLLNQPTCP